MVDRIARIWDVLSGARERREVRDAYLAALTTVADASASQTQMIHDWLRSFNTTGEPSKGWAVTAADEWLQEMKDEHPERFAGMPPTIEGDEHAQIDWLTSQAGEL